MNANKAILQFKDYKVMEMAFRADLSADLESEKAITPEFKVNIHTEDDDIKKAIIEIELVIGEEFNLDDVYVRVVVAGFFEMKTEIQDKDVIFSHYEINGVSILFPYVRSIVSDLTSKGSDQPIILPTMNIHAAIQAQKAKEREKPQKKLKPANKR